MSASRKPSNSPGMNAEKARGIILKVQGERDSSWHHIGGSDLFYQAQGYLAALQGPEVKALVEAYKLEMERTHSDFCIGNCPSFKYHVETDEVLAALREAVKP